MGFTTTVSGNVMQVRINTLKVSDTLNGRRTCTFDVYDKANALAGILPDTLVGKVTQVKNGATRIFEGLIRNQKYWIQEGTEDLVFSFECSDYSALADRHIVTRIYEAGQTLKAVITDLISNSGNDPETLAGDGVATVPVVIDSGGSSVVGPVLPRLVFSFQTVAQVFDTLAQLTGYSWLIDYDLTVYFRQSGDAAPFNIGDASDNFINLAIEITSDNYRNEEKILLDIGLIPPVTETFPGPFTPGTVLFMTKGVGAKPVITLRTAVHASAVLTFTGLPNNNDTVTVDTHVYTFKTVLSGAADEVLIGASAYECARNLAYAINAANVFAGFYFGQSTLPHVTCLALNPLTPALTVWATNSGVGGNGIAVAESCTNATWSASTLTGGVDGDEVTESVGVYGVDAPGSSQWYWLEGNISIIQEANDDPVLAGQFIDVTYVPIFSNVISLREQSEIDRTALIDGTTGLIANVTQDQNKVGQIVSADNAVTALATAQATLRRFGQQPRVATYDTDDVMEPLSVGLRAGMSQVINCTDYNINQPFLVETVSSSDIDGLYMKHQVTLIGFRGVIGEPQGSWVDFLASLVGGGAGSSGITGVVGGIPSSPLVGSGVSIVNEYTLVASPTAIPSPGTPGSGDQLAVFITQDGTGGRQITWDPIFMNTLVDIGMKPGDVTIFKYVGRSDSKWWLVSYMRPA